MDGATARKRSKKSPDDPEAEQQVDKLPDTPKTRKRSTKSSEIPKTEQPIEPLSDNPTGRLKIKQLALDDRPREKALKQGISTLSNAELIAILLRTGNDDETAIQVAQKILNLADNNLNKLGKMSVKELMKSRGVGQVKAITIAAAMEFGRRREDTEPVKRDSIQSSYDVFRLFYPFLCDLDHEELWVALINKAAKVVEKKKVSQGGVDNTVVDLITILKLAINTTCHGIFLCHNHPSGSIKPSAHDDVLTSRLKQAAKLLDIELLDHIIISDKYYYSYADEGRI